MPDEEWTPAWPDDPTDDEAAEREARHRATKRFALWALAAAVVIVAVSITLVATLVHEGNTRRPPHGTATSTGSSTP